MKQQNQNKRSYWLLKEINQSDHSCLCSPGDIIVTSFPAAGWLVDITGSYTATFILSGTALLASAVVLSVATGVRRCRRLLPPAV